MRPVLLLLATAALAQQPQNPSPMLDDTRAHHRLAEARVEGTRRPVSLGELLIPAHPNGRLLIRTS